MKAKKNTLALICVLVLIGILPLFIKNSYVIHMLIMMLFYAYLATSWNVMGGFLGYTAIGNGAYLAVGCYVTGALYKFYNINPMIGMLIAGVISLVLAFIIGYPCFRLRGSYYIMASMALLSIIRLIITNNQFVLGMEWGGGAGFRLPWTGEAMALQWVSKIPYYYIMLGLFAVGILISIVIKNTKLGYYFSAIKTNQAAAETLGVPTSRYKLISQLLSAFMTCIAGAFYVVFVMFIDPSRIVGFSLSFEILIYAIVGGADTIWGPTIGAVILYPLTELLRNAMPTQYSSLATAVFGLVLMVAVYYLPSGIYPSCAQVYEYIKHKVRTKRKQQT